MEPLIVYITEMTRIRSVISINYHYITVLCPFNYEFALNATILYKTSLTNINKYILHVLSIKSRNKVSIPTPGFPHFYFILGEIWGYFYTRSFRDV